MSTISPEEGRFLANCFLDEKYTDCIKRITKLLKSQSSFSNAQMLHLYCNRASCYSHLEMWKHCMQDCKRVLAIDITCVRARSLLIGTLVHKGDKVGAVKVWEDTLSQCAHTDLVLLKEIYTLIESLSNPSSTPSPTPSPAAPTPSPAAPAAAASSSKTVSSFPITPAITSAIKPVITAIKSSPTASSGLQVGLDPKGKSSGTHNAALNYSPELIAALRIAQAIGTTQGAQSRQAEMLLKENMKALDNDQQIAIGCLFVNQGKLEHAISLFDALIAHTPLLSAARLGRGSAYALQTNFSKALKDFEFVTSHDPKNIDAWIRRGQTAAAHGDSKGAVHALSQVFVHHTGPPNELVLSAYLQRAMVQHKQENERGGVEDALMAIRLSPNSYAAWNTLGLCYSAMGDVQEALSSYTKATKIEPKNKEAMINMAQAYRNFGSEERAFAFLKKAIAADPRHPQTYEMRGLLHYNIGDMGKAIKDLTRALNLDDTSKYARQMRGTGLLSLGRFNDALADYNTLISQNPTHVAWFLKEITLFYHVHIDTPFNRYNVDVGLHPGFKDIYIKVADPKLIRPIYIPNMMMDNEIPDVDHSEPLHPAILELINKTTPFNTSLQYQSPGFLNNKRQQRMFSLAIVDMAQVATKHCKSPLTLDGLSSSKDRGNHVFGWRDFMDIAVRWRQNSEPNDPVFWVDLLDHASFAQGFGLQTPLINEQKKVIRYYPYFDRCFTLTKSLLLSQSPLGKEHGSEVAEAKTVDELHALMGRDFFVITPCHSVCSEDVMEGTRLTVQKGPNGFKYSIRTPGTPDRFVQFDKELSACWSKIEDEMRRPVRNKQKLFELALEFYFYWVNFGALSRGTAACGLMAFHALLLLFGKKRKTVFPVGVQMDWEAITTPTPSKFREVVAQFMSLEALTDVSLSSFPYVSKAIPNLRCLLRACNHGIST